MGKTTIKQMSVANDSGQYVKYWSYDGAGVCDVILTGEFEDHDEAFSIPLSMYEVSAFKELLNDLKEAVDGHLVTSTTVVEEF